MTSLHPTAADLAQALVRCDDEATRGSFHTGRYRLRYATPDAAFLTVEDVLDDTRTVIADLAAGTLTEFPGDLSSEFVLLPPGALYKVTDTRFYTRDTLAETALPLPLAPGPVSPTGAYHLIVRE